MMKQFFQNISKNFYKKFGLPKRLIQFIIRIRLKLKFRKTIVESTNTFVIMDIFKGNLLIGEHTYIGDNGKFYSRGDKITIGKYCSISDNFYAITYNHPTEYVSGHVNQCNNINNLQQKYKHGDIVIGNDVWIGHNCTVLSGVTIGNGAIIGACSLVTRDVPPYAVVGGVPAKIIKYRFSEKQINFIEKLCWRDRSDKKILENVHLFNTRVNDLF